MFSAIFAGVASLAGAVLTRRDARKEAARVAALNRAEAARIQKANAAAAEKARKQNTQVRQDYYKNVVSDAQAAGINPLTALRTGGGQGYATAVAGTMSNPVMLEGMYQAPALSRNPLAVGLEAGTNTYLSELTRQKQYTHESRMDELNRALKVATLKSMQADLTRSSLPKNIFDGKANGKSDDFMSDPYAEVTTNEMGEVTDAEIKSILKTYSSTQGNVFSSILEADELMDSALLSAQAALVDFGVWAGMRPDDRRKINARIWNPINERINRFLAD